MSKNGPMILAAVVAAGAIAVGGNAHATDTLRAMTTLPKNLSLAESYIKNYVNRVNEVGGDEIQIKYIGGPEITSPRKAAAALKRGLFEAMHSPTAYYIGMVPEGYAMTLAQRTPAEVRANGGFALMQRIFAEKAGSRLIAWGESSTQYNTYLATEPKFDAAGNLSLKGVKMRVTGTYRPLFSALGATTVGIKNTEIYTALERGVVQGFGWPDVGYTGLGVHKLVKYRIDPPFYRSNNTATVNLQTWTALPRRAKEILETVGLEYEKTSVAYMEKERKREEQMALEEGMTIVKLEPKAAAHYLKAANAAVWKRLKDQSIYAEELKRLYFPDLDG